MSCMSREIAFIDSCIPELDTFVSGLRADVEAIVLSSKPSAPEQIARALSGREGLGAIHIIAHGKPGEVSFASGALTVAALQKHATHLAQVGDALLPDGQLLLWSCETGKGERGESFIAALEQVTGASVSAATDLIGSGAIGGSWKLNLCHGPSANPPLLPEAAAQYAYVLLTVNYAAGNPTYVENNPPLAVVSASITTGSSEAVTSITLSLGAGYNNTESLSGSSGVWNSTSGVFTISLGSGASDSDWASALNSVRYTDATNDNPSSSRSLQILVSSHDTFFNTNDSDFVTKTINVTPVNDAPTLGANTGLTLNEGASATVTATQLDFNDPDTADTAITYTVTSVATNGTLFKNGISLDLSRSFTQADINNNLITYTHNGGETASAAFGFSVSDGAGGLVTSQTFSFSITPVNDAPVTTAPVSVGSFNEDVPIVFSGGGQILVADVDSANLTVTLGSSAGGAFSLNGTAGLTFITGDGTSDGGMSFSGSQNAINTALRGLLYVPGANFVGLGRITIQTSDGAATDFDTISFSYTPVDDLPTVTLDNGLANIAENTSTTTRIKVADIVVTDVDGGTNVIGLSGTDADFFEIDGTELFLKAGTIIDFEQKVSYAVSITVDTPSLPPIALVSHTLNVANISPETLTGTAAAESLTGGSDADFIFGLDGNDILGGGDGADTLTGGLGKDTQTGGLGADIFDFNLKTESKKGAANYDVIMDFDTVLDHIDLADIDANSKRANNQDFKFIGAKAFSEKAGQLHYLKKAGYVLVEGDINGDGRADFQIKVQGVTKLLADDFFGVVVPLSGRLDHETAHHSDTAQHEDFDGLWGGRGL